MTCHHHRHGYLMVLVYRHPGVWIYEYSCGCCAARHDDITEDLPSRKA